MKFEMVLIKVSPCPHLFFMLQCNMHIIVICMCNKFLCSCDIIFEIQLRFSAGRTVIKKKNNSDLQ